MLTQPQISAKLMLILRNSICHTTIQDNLIQSSSNSISSNFAFIILQKSSLSAKEIYFKLFSSVQS